MLLQKPKERMCYECESKPPLVQQDSIYCSEECIAKHVVKAKAYLNKNRPKGAKTTSKVTIIAIVILSRK